MMENNKFIVSKCLIQNGEVICPISKTDSIPDSIKESEIDNTIIITNNQNLNISNDFHILYVPSGDSFSLIEGIKFYRDESGLSDEDNPILNAKNVIFIDVDYESSVYGIAMWWIHEKVNKNKVVNFIVISPDLPLDNVGKKKKKGKKGKKNGKKK